MPACSSATTGSRSAFEARAGLRVVVHGRIDVFDAQGVYQCYVAAIQPAGFGDLALRFERQRRAWRPRASSTPRRNASLPARPATIGVVTSLSGAVLHDIRRVLARALAAGPVVVSACQVQGDGAAETIVAALDRLARFGAACRRRASPTDVPVVLILARGGGSLEDLWPSTTRRVCGRRRRTPCRS